MIDLSQVLNLPRRVDRADRMRRVLESLYVPSNKVKFFPALDYKDFGKAEYEEYLQVRN